MKEIPDSEFDRLFKEKSQNFDYSFEEDAWMLMEKKLRKRDRIIFFRRSATAFAILFLLGGGYFLLPKSVQTNSDDNGNNTHLVSKKTKVLPNKPEEAATYSAPDSELQKENIEKITAQQSQPSSGLSKEEAQHSASIDQGEAQRNARIEPASGAVTKGIKPDKYVINRKINKVHTASSRNSTSTVQTNGTSLAARQDIPYASATSVVFAENLSGFLNLNEQPIISEQDPPAPNKPEKSKRLNPSYSFTFSAGPDFNSTASIAGKKATLNVGLLFNVSVKKFSLSTGAKYGLKDYDANVYDYKLRNPSRANLISTIDANCNVLEIPVQASYALLKTDKQKIELHTGLSSYLMLKEEYLFCYKPESGIKDYLLERNNANRSFFGVANISASYKFKPINQHIQLGIEPYVKLPLAGIGEGKVRLKSSGIAINMTYDLKKR